MTKEQKIKQLVLSRNWEGLFLSLSQLDRAILAAIGKNKRQTTNSLSSRLFARSNTIAAKIAILVNAGILIRVENGIFRIAHPSFAGYCDGRNPADYVSVDLEFAKQAIIADCYNLTAKRFESLEHLNLVVGNGHHMAQDISNYAAKIVEERWRSKN